MLSHKFRIPGYILIFAGFLLSVFYLTLNFRFELPVFAFISSFTGTNFFTCFKTNIVDEMIILFLIAGFSFLAFSSEKNESGIYKEIRVKALVKTVLIDAFLILFVTLFIYGSGFMVFLIANLILPFIIYLVTFNLMKNKASNPYHP